jgi:hypothetical protein
MSDMDRILEINQLIADDPHKPRLERIDALDPIDVEVKLLEADNLVEQYFKKYESMYQFQNPQMFPALVECYRVKFREHILDEVAKAKAYAKNVLGYSGGDNDATGYVN